jgi:CheY-like chemotaxis protein
MIQTPARRPHSWGALRRRLVNSASAAPALLLCAAGVGVLLAPSSWAPWLLRCLGFGLLLLGAALPRVQRAAAKAGAAEPAHSAIPQPPRAARHVAALVQACTPLVTDLHERAETALRTTFLSEKTRELEAIESVAGRLRLHLEAASELARLDNGTLVLDHAVFSLPELIARAVEAWSGRRNSALSVAPDVPDLVVGDAVHLGQIVTAILDRGSLAGGDDLAVFLERGSTTDNAVRVRFDWRSPETASPGDAWQAIRQEIDDSGRSAAPPPSPLALAVGLARAMRGDVTCSAARLGWRSIEVVVELLAERPDPRTDETVLEELRGRPVLILDGQEESRVSLGSLLTEFGLRPLVTADPHQAIASLRHAAAAREPFALLIVDPFLRGSAAFRARRNDDDSLAAATPQVIVVSGRTGPDTGYGPDTARLVRPVTRGDLIAVLRRALREPPLSSERQAPARPLRILVIQEEDDDASATARAIERLGHRAAIVRDAAEAARACAQRPFDCAVVGLGRAVTADLEGIRGLRQAAAQRGTPLWILATTARCDDGEERACRAAGADRYLERPFSLAVLRAALPNPDVAPASPAVPAIDWASLRAQLAGNEAAVADLLGEFCALADSMLTALADGLAERSPAATERAAHSLKGSLLWVRAAPAAELVRRIETQARAGDLTRGEDTLAALRREMRRVLEAIEREGPGQRSR